MQFTRIFTLIVLAVSVSAQAALTPDDAAPASLLSRSTKTTTSLKVTYCLKDEKFCRTRTTGHITDSQRKKKEVAPLRTGKCYTLGNKYNNKVRHIKVVSKKEETKTIKKDGKEKKETKEYKGKGCCRFYISAGCRGKRLREQKDGKMQKTEWFENSISSYRCDDKC